MSSVGGDSNPQCRLLYMAFITAANVGGENKLPDSQMTKRKGPVSAKANSVQLYFQKSPYKH